MSHATGVLTPEQLRVRGRLGALTPRRAIHLGARAALHEERVHVEDPRDWEGYRTVFRAGESLEDAIEALNVPPEATPGFEDVDLYGLALQVRDRLGKPRERTRPEERGGICALYRYLLASNRANTHTRERARSIIAAARQRLAESEQAEQVEVRA